MCDFTHKPDSFIKKRIIYFFLIARGYLSWCNCGILVCAKRMHHVFMHKILCFGENKQIACKIFHPRAFRCILVDLP